MTPATVIKTVAVLGASYGGMSTGRLNANLHSNTRSGAHAARVLAKGLPQGWRVVVVDRNSHMNHLYVLPRYAVLPGHEHKAFIPYTSNMFRDPDASVSSLFLHAQASALSPHSITVSRPFPAYGIDEPARKLQFDYLVYALGSHLPAPIDLWGPVADGDVIVPPTQGTKAEGIQWLKLFQHRIERSPSVLVVGGGALGVRK